MTMALQSIRESNGLNLQFDPLRAPEGSLVVADNVWCNREHILAESRRGFDRYGAAATNQIKRLLEYRDALLRHYGSTLQYDNAGTWTSYSGSFSAPDATHRMRNAEARRNNYLTTSLGVYKQDALATAPVRSGVEQALDLRLAKAGTGNGFAVGDTQVGYKVLWGRIDANDRLLLGAPSFDTTYVNAKLSTTYTSVGDDVTVSFTAHGFSVGDKIEIENASDSGMDGEQTVSAVPDADSFEFVKTSPSPASGNLDVWRDDDIDIEVIIPDDVVDGDFYEVYRTLLSADATTLPSPEYFKVTRQEVDGDDISAGTVTYTDTALEEFLDVRIYTSPSQGTISRQHDRPPYAKDVALFKGHLILANVKWEEEVEIQLKDTAGLTDDTSSITIGAETYTFSTAENVGSKKFQRYTTPTDFATLAEAVAATARSLVYVINKGSTAYYAFYTSAATEAPGKILIRHRALNGSTFSITADVAGTGDNFEPVLPTSGTDVSSVAPGAENELSIGQFEEPESHHRSLSREPVGSEDDPIERIVALRDSLLIFKKLGGMWVLSGETDRTTGSSFKVKSRDQSLRIFGIETLVVLDNSAYLHSTKGFVRANENGTEIIGRQVEKKTRELAVLSSFESLSHAISYESEHLYICWTPLDSTETTTTTLGWVYNAITRKVTHGFVKDCSSGHVLSADDKLYLAHGTDDFVLQERKSHDEAGSDFMDEDIAATVTAVSTKTNAAGVTVSLVTVTYTYTGAALTDGFRFAQAAVFASVVAVTDLGGNSYQLELSEELPGLANGACTLSIPIYVAIKTAPVAGKDVSLLKQFNEVHIELEEDTAYRHFVGFATDIVPVEVFNTTAYEPLVGGSGWGRSAWGSSPWGDGGARGSTPVVVQVPSDYCRGRRLRILYKNQTAGEKVSLSQISVYHRAIGRRSSVKSAS